MQKSIIYRFVIPHTFVSNNCRQFDNLRFRQFCSSFGIINTLSSSAYPQANGQVEVVNKVIKFHLKIRLENLKSAWVEELPVILWTYQTSVRTSSGKTHFSLAFGIDVVAPVEEDLIHRGSFVIGKRKIRNYWSLTKI